MSSVVIHPVSPAAPPCARLIAELDQYQQQLYPAASNHLESVAELTRPGVIFLGAHIAARIVGIGAVKIVADDIRYGEIKRLYVPVYARGQGISVLLMAALEQQAQAQGVAVIRLETGIYQPQALGLYKKLGYRQRTSFGNYPTDDPLSVFMEKVLTDDKVSVCDNAATGS